MQQVIALDFTDLGFCVALMAITIGLSAWERLGLEYSLGLASGRTILQLVVLGYALDSIYKLNNGGAVLAILAIILTISAIVAKNRITTKIPLALPLVWGCFCFPRNHAGPPGSFCPAKEG